MKLFSFSKRERPVMEKIVRSIRLAKHITLIASLASGATAFGSPMATNSTNSALTTNARKFYNQNGDIKAARNGSINLMAVISGQVIDENGLGLPGVTITSGDGKPLGQTSNDGKFSVQLPDGQLTLIFSYTGYKRLEVKATSGIAMKIKLEPSVNGLNDVVVVGYGSKSKRLVTGSIQSINSAELKDIPVPSATQKLQGKLAGVQINQTSGEPGKSMQVTIRGGASISTDANPLYVVDGFPITGDLRNINPNEIESISVLKDATATALYGSRAAFGVVLVTTKGASTGKTNISISAYTGVQSLPQKGRPDMMNGQEYAQFRKEIFEDKGLAVPAVFQNPAQYGEGYDWYDAMFKNAPISDYSVSISSGTNRLKNALVISYFDQDGIMINTGYKRFAIRNNTSYHLSDNLSFGINLAPAYVVNKNPGSDGWFNGGTGAGLLNNAMLTPPILAFQNPDGSYPVSVTKSGVTAFPTTNWIRSAQDITRVNKAFSLLSNAYLQYSPVKDLVLKSTFNVQTEQSYFNFFQPSTATTNFATEPSATNAALVQNTSRFYTWVNENTANYSKKIGRHSFDLLAGYTIQRFRSDATSVSGSNFPDDRVRTINAALVKNNATSDIQEWSMLSYLSRLNYNFDEKYLLSASIRRDGSSRFGANNKWGSFPAVSAGWIASEEPFLKNQRWLSLLKFKGGYGVVGNNNIGNYTQYATLSNSNVVFGNVVSSGVATSGLGNPELGWETTKELSAGLELGVLNNRIIFSYDYYNRKTSNLLLGIAVPRESGFSGLTANVGQVRFWGHEFNLSTQNLTGNFKWNTNFNISFSENKVLALSTLTDRIYTSNIGIDMTITKVGDRIGQFWGLVRDGIYNNQAEFSNGPKGIGSDVGTIRFRDLNGDGVIKYGNDEGDRTVIGNPFPKAIFGMTNSFAYKNFDLNVVLSGSWGNDIARMYDAATANLDGVFNVYKDVKDRWRSPSNPGAGLYGKTTSNTADQRSYMHTGFVFDGSYLTIKNIALGYTFPVKDNKIFSALRLYSSVQQAFVFTGYQGNPEVTTSAGGITPNSIGRGFDYSAYPIPRTFTFGLNVNLK